MSYTKTLIALLFGLMGQMNAWAADFSHPYACVLNFERRNHPLSTTLQDKLSDMDGVRIVNEARPIDILDCLDNGAISVTIIGHAADLDSKKQVTAPLVYFKELKGEERDHFLNAVERQLAEEMAELRKHEPLEFGSSEETRYRRNLEESKRLRSLPKDEAVYDQPILVENQIWKRVLGNPKNLKKISIVACLPEKVAAHYPELRALQSQGIEVEFGPINRFLSFFMGKNVASPDFDWMRKTLDESRPDPRVANQELKIIPSESPQQGGVQQPTAESAH